MSPELAASARRILARVHPCAAEAVAEVLASYGVASSSRDAEEAPPPSSRTCAVSLGYTSANLQGVVTVVATTDVWERVYVSAGLGEHPDLHALHDFAAELANMVLGKVKRRYTRDGVDVDVALPVAASGIDLVLGRTAGLSQTTFASVGESPIAVTSSVLLTAPVELVPDSGTDSTHPAGEMFLL